MEVDSDGVGFADIKGVEEARGGKAGGSKGWRTAVMSTAPPQAIFILSWLLLSGDMKILSCPQTLSTTELRAAHASVQRRSQAAHGQEGGPRYDTRGRIWWQSTVMVGHNCVWIKEIHLLQASRPLVGRLGWWSAPPTARHIDVMAV